MLSTCRFYLLVVCPKAPNSSVACRSGATHPALLRSPDLQLLALPAARASEQHAQSADVLVVFACQRQPIGTALETFHIETAERAFGRRARRLVVFAADEVSGGIHTASLPARVGQIRAAPLERRTPIRRVRFLQDRAKGHSESTKLARTLAPPPTQRRIRVLRSSKILCNFFPWPLSMSSTPVIHPE